MVRTLLSLDADALLSALQPLPAADLARLSRASRAARAAVRECVKMRVKALGFARAMLCREGESMLHALAFVEKIDALPRAQLAAGYDFSLVISPRDKRAYSFGGPHTPVAAYLGYIGS